MVFRILPGIFLLAATFPLRAQVSGKVSNEKGEALPFTSVYLKGTSTGTTTNSEGEFMLHLAPGSYELVFQYIGFEQRVEEIEVNQEPLYLNVVLREEAVTLQEVVVRPDAEDPAYEIIRNAIARRKYYRDLVDAYSCDVYLKGNIKFLNAPEKVLGVEVGDLMGSLDSNRQGIIYLSESQSRLSFRQPDQFKEEVHYTKVSGNDNGFGFNSAAAMDFDLYRNYAEFNRQLVSPIAGNALAYYDYRLVGTLVDQEGYFVNKIELIPKRSEDPVYRGFIYIVDDQWLIQGAELLLLSGAVKQPGLDSLWIRQVYLPVRKPDTWRLFSQVIRFRAGLFGFQLEGAFTGIYSNYDLDPRFPGKYFDNEVYKVEEGANEKPLAYWDSIRPIPLTRDEAVDYVRKDSLQEVRQSKAYLDSVDTRNNRFRPINLLFGYSYDRSYQRRYFSIGSPLTTLQFNTVQGFNADLALTYQRDFDELARRWLRIRPRLSYGFSDRRLRWSAEFAYRFNQVKRPQLTVEGGVDAVQFNDFQPIGKTVNSLYTLLGRKNYLKVYDKTYGRISYQQELINGVFLRASVDYSRRSPLVNSTDYSFTGDKAQAFSSNDPRDPENDGPAFTVHQALTVAISLRLRYRQKYISYPGRKFVQGSSLPDLWIDYRGGVRAFGGDVRYDYLGLRIVEDEVRVGVLGSFAFRAEGGTFLSRDSIAFMDYRHFNGNQTVLGNPDRYLSSFMLLPYYERSTISSFVQAHFQHDFESFLLDKIPGIRKLGWTTILGASFLYTGDQKDYLELSLGWDNIGFGAFRLFRFDGVASFQSQTGWDFGFMIGVKLP